MAYRSHNARLACTPARSYSGVASIAGGGLMAVRGNWEKSGNLRNRFGAFDRVTGGTPSSVRPPAAWILAPTAGGMSTRNEIDGTGTLTGAGARGVNGVATITAAGDLAGTGQLVVSGAVSIVATGTLSGNVVAALAASAAVTGAGTLTAVRSALANGVAVVTASGTLVGANNAVGHMAADITNVPAGVTTPDQVWDSVLIETGLTAREAMRILAAVVAGRAEASGSSISFYNALGDNTVRVEATVDGTGNRTGMVWNGG